MRVTQLAMMIGLVAACAVGVETYTWDAGGDGSSWTDAANWDLGSGYPSNNTHAVVITNGNAAITVPAGTTLGALTRLWSRAGGTRPGTGRGRRSRSRTS